MSDLSLNLEGVAPEVAAVLQSDAARAVIAAAIEAAKVPLINKRDELLGKVKTFEDSVSQAEKARKDAELAAAEKDGSIDSVKKHYGEQLSTKEKELSELRASVVSEKVSNQLNAAIREANGVPELLEPHLKNRIKSELVDGKVKIVVLAPNGAPMLTTDGKDASISDLLTEFKATATFGRAFGAPPAGGSGAKPSSTVSTTTNPWAPTSKNLDAQMKLYRTDKATAIRMAAEHGVVLA